MKLLRWTRLGRHRTAFRCIPGSAPTADAAHILENPWSPELARRNVGSERNPAVYISSRGDGSNEKSPWLRRAGTTGE